MVERIHVFNLRKALKDRSHSADEGACACGMKHLNTVIGMIGAQTVKRVYLGRSTVGAHFLNLVNIMVYLQKYMHFFKGDVPTNPKFRGGLSPPKKI